MMRIGDDGARQTGHAGHRESQCRVRLLDPFVITDQEQRGNATRGEFAFAEDSGRDDRCATNCAHEPGFPFRALDNSDQKHTRTVTCTPLRSIALMIDHR
jgi:hypothetical protein